MDVAIISGAFFGAFGVSLVIAAIWLIIAEIIPPLRKRPKGTHIIAMVLAVLTQLVPYGGPSAINILAAVVCVRLLVWRMKRIQSKFAVSSGVVESKHP